MYIYDLLVCMYIYDLFMYTCTIIYTYVYIYGNKDLPVFVFCWYLRGVPAICTFLQILEFWRGENISGLFCQRTQIELATLTWGQLPFSRRASLQIPRRGALWWTGFDLLVSPSPSCPTAQLRQDSAPCHGAGVPPRPACILTFSGHNEQITFINIALLCRNLRTRDFGIESSVPGWGSITSYIYNTHHIYTCMCMWQQSSHGTKFQV